ncbi:Rieske 2Fe-2S domain-containing protein [Novosphingobium sp. BL-52-GroH]|uniref:Rieske 2Fe-2S domain-containing protein n=1 Tax=Novosphingobium sp. BL-52-GroH TaxID=3349877 RepID=UPI00384CCCE1
MERYLKHCWYMAAWANEIGENGLTREILGRPMYFYRLESGKLNAIVDRCPHRFAPLSCGTRKGDNLVCGYHGLTFAPDGHCVHNPFSDKIPVGANITTFAVEKRDEIVWMWGGKPEEADPSLIPPFPFVPDAPNWRTVTGYTLMQANYEYGTDNLMDLSHIEFVHKGTFAGDGVIFAGKHEVIQEGDTLHSNWWMPNIPPPSMAQGRVAEDAIVDHWFDMQWYAPATMRLFVGACPHGEPREAGFAVPFAHILTPANDHETHYFWSSSRDHDTDSPEVDGFLKQLFGEAFDKEDKPIIEAAYKNVRGKDFWQEKPLSLGIDQGGTRARRMLETLIKREQVQDA